MIPQPAPTSPPGVFVHHALPLPEQHHAVIRGQGGGLVLGVTTLAGQSVGYRVLLGGVAVTVLPCDVRRVS